MVETTFVVDASSKRFDAKIKGKHATRLTCFLLFFVDKGGVVTVSSVPGYCYLLVAGGGWFGKPSNNVGVTFIFFAFAACRECDRVPSHLKIHFRVAQGKEVAAWAYPWEPWCLTVLNTTEEGLHRSIQAKVNLMQQLSVDKVEFRVVLFALLQRLLRLSPSRPLLAVTQAHDPPVVETSTFALHKFEGFSVLV